MEANAWSNANNPVGSSADRIELSRTTYLFALSGSGGDFEGDLDLTEDVDIVAHGGARIDAGGLDRVFHVHPGVTVALEGLTISGGVASDGPNMSLFRPTMGGGVWNEGDLVVKGGSIARNSANRGGGLANTGLCDLIEVHVDDNQSDGWGAGVFSDGDLVVTDSWLSDNAGAPYVDGAGLLVYGGVAELRGTRVERNIDSQHGAGAAVRAGAMIDVHDSWFTDNETSLYGTGGGLYIYSYGEAN